MAALKVTVGGPVDGSTLQPGDVLRVIEVASNGFVTLERLWYSETRSAMVKALADDDDMDEVTRAAVASCLADVVFGDSDDRYRERPEERKATPHREFAAPIDYDPTTDVIRITGRRRPWGPRLRGCEESRREVIGWGPYTHLVTLRDTTAMTYEAAKYWLIGSEGDRT